MKRDKGELKDNNTCKTNRLTEEDPTLEPHPQTNYERIYL